MLTTANLSRGAVPELQQDLLDVGKGLMSNSLATREVLYTAVYGEWSILMSETTADQLLPGMALDADIAELPCSATSL